MKRTLWASMVMALACSGAYAQDRIVPGKAPAAVGAALAVVCVDPSTGAPNACQGSGGGGGQSGTNISVIPTIQNAAYAANNCMGTGFQTVAMGATPSVLNQVSIASKGGLTLAKTVWLFTANPSGSTCTDKGTFTVAQADMGKVVAIITLTPAASNGQTGTFASQSGLGLGIPSGGTMYAAIVDSGVETPGSTTDIIVGFSGF